MRVRFRKARSLKTKRCHLPASGEEKEMKMNSNIPIFQSLQHPAVKSKRKKYLGIVESGTIGFCYGARRMQGDLLKSTILCAENSLKHEAKRIGADFVVCSQDRATGIRGELYSLQGQAYRFF